MPDLVRQGEATVDEAKEASDVLDLFPALKDLDKETRTEMIRALVFYARAVHEFTLVTKRLN